MPKGQGTFRGRRSVRLRNYDYRSAGAYFVTVCSHNRRCLFGNAANGSMVYTPLGEVAVDCWQWLARRYPYVDLDYSVVMPNHVHGIILLGDPRDGCRGGSRTAPTGRKPLGRLIGAFKTVSAKRINRLRGRPAAGVWQRNFYEHVIRNERELLEIRRYILENPLKWELDRENPMATGRPGVSEPWEA